MTPFRVGLVVIVGVASFLWMFARVEEGIGRDPSGYTVCALFKDASGLTEKSRVVIAGITVGEIADIKLAGDKAKVFVRVNTPLRSDARIAKRQASLLGEYYLELAPGYVGTPLKEGDCIEHVDVDVAPAELMNELKKIAENVREVTESLRRVVANEQGEQRLVDILENVNQTIAELKRAVQENSPKIDKVVENVVEVTDEARRFTREFRRDAKRIMDNAQVVASDARAITGNVRDLIGRNSESVDESFEGVTGAVHRLQSALGKLDDTLDHTRSIAGKIDEGKGTIGKLVNDDQLHENVNDLVAETGGFIKKITRLQTIIAMRSEYYLGTTSVKNYLSLKLQPAPDKYYLLQLIDDPRGRSIFRETVTSSSDSQEDPVIREQQTITEDRFRLSLQFAKRWYFMTGRIGIIENTGGVGLDVHLFDDALEISTDLFNFDANVNPQMKVWAHYTFFTHLFIAAGIDEVWNDELTDFFIGAGITFNDDDLKAILTTAPPNL